MKLFFREGFIPTKRQTHDPGIMDMKGMKKDSDNSISDVTKHFISVANRFNE